MLDMEDGGIQPMALLIFCHVLLCRIRKLAIGGRDREMCCPCDKIVGSLAKYVGWLGETVAGVGQGKARRIIISVRSWRIPHVTSPVTASHVHHSKM